MLTSIHLKNTNLFSTSLHFLGFLLTCGLKQNLARGPREQRSPRRAGGVLVCSKAALWLRQSPEQWQLPSFCRCCGSSWWLNFRALVRTGGIAAGFVFFTVFLHKGGNTKLIMVTQNTCWCCPHWQLHCGDRELFLDNALQTMLNLFMKTNTQFLNYDQCRTSSNKKMCMNFKRFISTLRDYW